MTTGNIFLEEMYKSLDAIRERRREQRESSPPFAPDLPVRMPIPSVAHLNEAVDASRRYPDEEYNNLSNFVLFLVLLITIWYFWPKPRHQIAPPRPYMDSGPGQGIGSNVGLVSAAGKAEAQEEEKK